MSYYIWTNTLDVLALTDAVVPMSVVHHTACVYIYKVSVHIVITHVEGIGSRFAISPGVCTRGGCKAVQTIVGIGM